MEMYADGRTMPEISEVLDISVTSLVKWKTQNVLPNGENGWDKARAQKKGILYRLRDLYDRQLEYVEGLDPKEISSMKVDALSKMGSMLTHHEKVEVVLRKLSSSGAQDGGGNGEIVVGKETIKQLREELGL